MVCIRPGLFSFSGIHLEFSYTFPSVCVEVLVDYMYIRHDGKGEWELLRCRCECEYDYTIDHEWAHQVEH